MKLKIVRLSVGTTEWTVPTGATVVSVYPNTHGIEAGICVAYTVASRKPRKKAAATQEDPATRMGGQTTKAADPRKKAAAK